MMLDRSEYVIGIDRLPGGVNAVVFDGHEHGANVSFFITRNRPGTGPELHRHPYEETFIIQEGKATFTVGEGEIEAGAGEIVVLLRPLSETEEDALRRVSNEFLVRRYLWDGEPVSRGRIEKLVAQSGRRFYEEGLCLFGVRLQGDDTETDLRLLDVRRWDGSDNVLLTYATTTAA